MTRLKSGAGATDVVHPFLKSERAGPRVGAGGPVRARRGLDGKQKASRGCARHGESGAGAPDRLSRVGGLPAGRLPPKKTGELRPKALLFAVTQEWCGRLPGADQKCGFPDSAQTHC